MDAMEPNFREFPLTEDEIRKQEIEESEAVELDSAKQFKKFNFAHFLSTTRGTKLLTSLINTPYRKVFSVLQQSQIVFAVLIAFISLLVPEIRNDIIMKSWRQKAIIIVVECFSLTTIAYLLGLNRMPINFITLVITRVFLAMETKYNSQANDYETKAFNRLQVIKSIRNRDGSTGQLETISEAHYQLRNILLMGLFVSAAYIITRFTKIQIAKLDSLALFGTFVCSTTGTVILISSLAIDRIGKDTHLVLCKCWSHFALMMTFSLALFLIQRLMLLQQKQLSFKHSNRMHFESLICFFQIYLVIQYIPVIHPGFSFRQNFTDGIPTWGDFVKVCVPKSLQPFVDEIPTGLYAVAHIMENYYMLLPNGMLNVEP